MNRSHLSTALALTAGLLSSPALANIPAPGDYDGDGVSDLVEFRRQDGFWFGAAPAYGGALSHDLPFSGRVQWGAPEDIPVPGDYNGDGTTDIAVWRPSNGRWYIVQPDENGDRGAQLPCSNTHWGMAGDIPVPGDYDGNGTTDIAVWRPSNGVWYIRGTDHAGRDIGMLPATFTQWGAPTDIPVPGDYDGNGTTDIAVWRPSNGAWYAKGTDHQGAVIGNLPLTGFAWGMAGDVPVAADYNGDGTTDVAVWRPSNGVWYAQATDDTGAITHMLPLTGHAWGMVGDVPAPGDYNGDGTADLMVRRPSGGHWFGYATGRDGDVVAPMPRSQWYAPQGVSTGEEDGLVDIALLDAGGVTLRFGDAQFEVNDDGSLAVSGEVSIGVGDLRTTLAAAELEVTLDGGRIATLMGRARVQPSPVAMFAVAEFDDLIEGQVGLAYGNQLGHLGAPLQPDTRYFYVNLEAGPAVGLGPVSAAIRGGATFVLDASDPMFLAEGRIEGLSELTVIEQAAVGLSAHGRIPLAAAHTWGLEGIDTTMDGHLYTAGRFVVPKTPLTLDGEALLDLDPDDDGQTLFHGDVGAGMLFNGSAEVEIAFGPFPGFNVPMASVSAGGYLTADEAQVWYSGESGLDLAELLGGLPLAMHNQRYVAGLVSTNLEDSFIAFGASAQLGSWDIADALLHISPQGATLDAEVQLHALTLALTGDIDRDDFSLTGTGRVDLPVRAPNQVTEVIDVAVNYTANAAICGYDQITSAAICGTEVVADAAVCGTDTITNGAQCGYDTIRGWFCGLSGLCSRQEARTCEVARSCSIAATCDVAASCSRIERRNRTRLVPDFDFGDLRVEVSMTVDGGGEPDLSAEFQFCPTGGGCAGFSPTEFIADNTRFRVCGDFPVVGHHCIER